MHIFGFYKRNNIINCVLISIAKPYSCIQLPISELYKTKSASYVSFGLEIKQDNASTTFY
jgi:hypothetical protein